MISKFFKSEYYIQLFVLILTTIIVLIFKSGEYQINDDKFSNSIYKITINHNFLKSSFYFILIILNSLIIKKLLSDVEIINKKSLFPAFIFSFTALLFINTPNFEQVIICNLIIVFSLGEFLKIYNRNESYETIFNISFIFSLLTTIYFPLILFIPIIWLTFIIFRIFKWREWVISIIGIITPYFILSSYYFLTDDLEKYLTFLHLFFNNINIIKYSLNTNEKLFLIGFIILFLISFFNFMIKYNDKNIYLRKKIAIMLNFTILCILIIFIGHSESKENFLFLTTSFSLFFTSYLAQIKKKWLSEFLYYIIIFMFLVMFLKII